MAGIAVLAVVFGAGWFTGSRGDDSVEVTSAEADGSTGAGTTAPETPDPETTGPTDVPTSTGSAGDSTDDDGTDGSGDEPASSSSGQDVAVPAAKIPKAPVPKFTCPDATVEVKDAAELTAALREAGPGTVISLKDGQYQGGFVATAGGTASDPIYLCGGRGAVLVGEGHDDGYVLHFDGAAYWRASGFTVRDGQKGVMVDGGHHLGLQDLLVESTGDEAVHLRKNSTDNVVRGLTIRDTGHRRDKFGEGVYVGTAESNWGDITGGEPDHSDRNFVLDNTITAVTAEAVDVKEGTSAGVVAGNTFDGSAMTDKTDSWVDIKGNGWLIAGNTGRKTTGDGFQTHVIVDGWGDKNRFTGNVADITGGEGVGYYLHEQLANEVSCDNKVSGGELSNDPCTK